MKRLLKELIEEYHKENSSSPPPSFEIPEIESTYTLEVEDIEILISDVSPAIALSSSLTLPSHLQLNQEDLYMVLLRGNFMGQATRNASLGLSEDGSEIVLLRTTNRITSYREFKDAIEDFINAACFWKVKISPQ